MSVSAPFNTLMSARFTGTGPYDATMTIASGHSNTALLLWVEWSDAGLSTISSIVWDPAGANQSMTSIGSRVVGGTSRFIQGFVLINPTAGASKTVRVTTSGSVTDLLVDGGVYDGVDQTTPTANLTSNLDGSPLTVTAASGDATSTAVISTLTITGTDQTIIGHDDTGADIAGGADYALATGNVTHTWTMSGSLQMVVGCAIKASTGGGGSVNITPGTMLQEV